MGESLLWEKSSCGCRPLEGKGCTQEQTANGLTRCFFQGLPRAHRSSPHRSSERHQAQSKRKAHHTVDHGPLNVHSVSQTKKHWVWFKVQILSGALPLVPQPEEVLAEGGSGICHPLLQASATAPLRTSAKPFGSTLGKNMTGIFTAPTVGLVQPTGMPGAKATKI